VIVKGIGNAENLRNRVGTNLLNFKNMKKIISTIVVGIFILNYAFATKYPVLSRAAAGGGILGYDYTNATLCEFEVTVPNTNITKIVSGYSVTCLYSGWQSCPKLGEQFLPASPPDEWDGTQISKVDYLIEYAYNQIENNNLDGTYNIVVQVQGESFYRYYYLSWTADDSTGTTSDILIEREDIAF